MRPLQRESAGRKRGLPERWIEHAADLRVTGMPAARQHDGLARPNVHDLATLVDVSVLPVAFHSLTGIRMHARRVMRLDTHDSTGKRLLAHELVETAMQHELHALLARRELQTPRQRGTIADGARRHGPG